MTASAMRLILVPDMLEGLIRSSAEIRERVPSLHPVDIGTGFEPSPTKAPRQVLAHAARALREHDQNQRMRHRLHGTDLPPLKPGAIPSTSEFCKAI
jgi:hypothetical protein